MPDALGPFPNTVIDTPGLVGYVSVPEHMQTLLWEQGGIDYSRSICIGALGS
jgi:hypothetical protein